MRLSLKGEIDKLRVDTKADMRELETRMTKAMYNAMFGFAGAIAAFIAVACAVTIAWLR